MKENEKQVWIREPNATVNHHFPFKIGDEVTIKSSGETATVDDAVFEAEEPSGGAFTITYRLLIEDGRRVQVEMIDLVNWDM